MSQSPIFLQRWLEQSGSWSPDRKAQLYSHLASQTDPTLSSPGRFAVRASEGRWEWAPHLHLIDAALVRAARQGGQRIIIAMPPRHGKSELCSRFFPPWFLGSYPDKSILLASYQAGIASTWGRRSRQIMQHWGAELFGVQVAMGSKAADRWEIANHRGGMVTTGVGGALTGRGADILLVDDPVKNAAEANSLVYRERLWDWWQSTAYTRLEPGASVVVIMTRWHEDDLVGRLITFQPETWDVLHLPALADPNDALGREEGAALWPERYSVEDLLDIRDHVGAYYFEALYQGRPTAAEGAIFRREHFRYCEERGESYRLHDGAGGHRDIPRSRVRLVQAVDLAASTKQDADYTVVLTVGFTPDQDILVLDVERQRLEGPEQLDLVERAYLRVRPIMVGIERTAYQLTMVQHARRRHIPVRELLPDRDKVSRAITASIFYEGGQVYHLAGAPWLMAFESELLAFPRGQHDDQVDALAYAATLGLKGALPTKPEREERPLTHTAGLSRQQW